MKVVIGIGCDRGTELQTLEVALNQALALAGIERNQVAACASIDKKNDEPALLKLAEIYHWPIHFYPAEALATVEVPNPSEVVRKYVGTPAVAEAAALLHAGITMNHLLVEKYKYRGEDDRNATISIVPLLLNRS